jgi:hypothetical protein
MLVRGEALDKDTVVCTRLVTDASEGGGVRQGHSCVYKVSY